MPSPFSSAALVARCDAWSLAVGNGMRLYTRSEPHSKAVLLFHGSRLGLLTCGPRYSSVDTDCLVWYIVGLRSWAEI